MFFVLCLFTASAQNTTVFSSDFNTQDDFNRWTVINANGDNYTWAYYVNSTYGTASIRWNSSQNADDWLISPAITLPSDGIYKLTMIYKGGGSSSHEKMDISYGTSPTAEAMTQSIIKMDDITGDYYQIFKILVKMTAGQPIYLGFHAYSDANQWRILINDIKLETSTGIDVSVNELMSPATGDNLGKAEPVKIKIANNGASAVSNIPVGYSINGNEAIKETFSGTIAPGASAEYTFTKTADISTVRSSYKFKAWASVVGDEIVENDTIISSVYNNGNATVPYKMGFEASENKDAFKYYNLNEDTGNWSVAIETGFFNMARTGNGCLMYDYDKNNAGNDWVILDGIEVEPGYYSFKFWYSSVNNHNERLAAYYGNGNTPNDMTNKVVEYSPYNSDDFLESSSVIKITEKQVIYLGFKAFSDKNENDILVDDVSLTKIDPSEVDLAVSNITFPDNFVRAASNKDIVYNITNKGISKVDNATIKVSVDDNVVNTETISLDAQASITKTITNGISSLAEGKHSVKIEVAIAGDENIADNTSTKNFVIVGSPTKFWDFENYTSASDGTKVFTRPSDLTYINKDGGTLNASVASYFPDNLGWGPVEIVKHATLGECMLGVTSYIDGVTNANRWCIFPQMRITDDNAYFIWDANSMDPSYPESYKIMISDSSADPDWFSTAATINNETAASKTRGIDLSSYKGKDIYVAIRLISRSSFILVVDNIGFYGNAQFTGINDITASGNAKLTLNGKNIIGSSEINAIELYDMSGRKVLSTQSNVADASSVSAGIYIAVGKTANGQVKEKFVIK